MTILDRPSRAPASTSGAGRLKLRPAGAPPGALAAFVRARRGRIALIPSRDIVFAVLGDPLGDLDLAWLARTGEYRLRDLVRTRGLSSDDAANVWARLRWAFRSHASAPRRGVAISGREVDVIPSAPLAAELRRVVTEVLS